MAKAERLVPKGKIMDDRYPIDTQNRCHNNCHRGKRGNFFLERLISIEEDELLTFPIPCIAKPTTQYIP